MASVVLQSVEGTQTELQTTAGKHLQPVLLNSSLCANVVFKVSSAPDSALKSLALFHLFVCLFVLDPCNFHFYDILIKRKTVKMSTNSQMLLLPPQVAYVMTYSPAGEILGVALSVVLGFLQESQLPLQQDFQTAFVQVRTIRATFGCVLACLSKQEFFF